MNDTTLYTNLADAVNSAVTRRKFMQLSGVGAGSVLGGSLLAKLQAVAAPPISTTDGVLVMVYLGGGNDPLNTFAPYSNNRYRSLRPDLHLDPNHSDVRRKCLPIDNVNAFHSSLQNVKSLYDNGKVSVIPGVGFDGQDLSHFTSAASYMGGWTGDGKAASGWAGRFLDTLPNADQVSTRGVTINGSKPLAILGEVSRPISLPTNIARAYNAGTSARELHCVADLNRFTGYEASSMSGLIAEGLHGAIELPADYKGSYPDISGLVNPPTIERNLAIAAGLINSNMGARVIHVSLGGFDNHINQLNDHANQLAQLDKAIGTFFDILGEQFADRVTLMIYSEFGRRAHQNGNGTDHGRAALMMLMGNRVKGGLRNDLPSLDDLDLSGNLKHSVDFRKIYGEISNTWLKTDEERILGTSYAPLGLFLAGPGNSTGTPGTQPPQTQPPVTQPPVTQPPVTQPPVTTTPVTRPPVTTTPATRPPVTTTPVTRPPVTQPPAPTVPRITDEQVIRGLLRRWFGIR